MTEQASSQPALANGPTVLSTGELIFRVRKQDGEAEYPIDLFVLKLTCEECEQSHGIVAVDGKMQPTAAFLVDLAGRLESRGVCGCTPTVAWQMWIAAADAMNELKKKLSEMPN